MCSSVAAKKRISGGPEMGPKNDAKMGPQHVSLTVAGSLIEGDSHHKVTPECQWKHILVCGWVMDTKFCKPWLDSRLTSQPTAPLASSSSSPQCGNILARLLSWRLSSAHHTCTTQKLTTNAGMKWRWETGSIVAHRNSCKFSCTRILRSWDANLAFLVTFGTKNCQFWGARNGPPKRPKKWPPFLA